MILPLLLLISGINVQPNSLVDIKTIAIDGEGGGAGVIVEKNRVLTAAHVLNNVLLATATCGDREIPIKPIAIADSLDLALVEYLEDCPIEPIALADKNPLMTSDIYVIGCPSGKCFIATKGIVAGYSFNKRGIPRMYSDAKVWYGNSGGPAIDSNGKLVGILSAMMFWSTVEIENKELEVNSQNYAVIVPISVIKNFLEEAKKIK